MLASIVRASRACWNGFLSFGSSGSRSAGNSAKPVAMMSGSCGHSALTAAIAECGDKGFESAPRSRAMRRLALGKEREASVEHRGDESEEKDEEGRTRDRRRECRLGEARVAMRATSGRMR